MSDLNKFLMADVEEIPEADVSSFEKKVMKKRLLGKKRKAPWLKKLAAAASILIAASGATAVAFPSLASQIPILQNIVSYFEDDELLFNHFSEVAQPLGLTETASDSTITIEEAVYDGTSVTISFALKTDIDLGNLPVASGQLEAEGAGGSGSSISMNKANDTTYAGLITMAPDFGKRPPKTLNVSWEPQVFEDFETGHKLEGDWAFSFKLNAIDSKSVQVDHRVNVGDGSYTVNELLLTKLSTVLSLDKENIDEDHYITEWQITDNIGNAHIAQFGTGSESHMQFTFEALDPEATAVTITPLVQYYENMQDEKVEGEKIDLPSVTVELN
ncbi:DUF4179 domain-containing protein [Planococcus sp. YIM B11945]|uniref:DUF4179 domain-containing protein n=1 Tax=Planococcus sp. YIM B11945 TaxID=3435410 RepID=UPI003D7C4E4B